MEKISSTVLKVLVAICFCMLPILCFSLDKKTVCPGILHNYVTYIIAAGVVVIWLYFAHNIEYKKMKPLNLWLVFILLFVGQEFICLNITFRTTWDPMAVMYSANFAALKDRDGMADMASYLSIYPSNMLLVWIYSLVYSLNNKIHITEDALNLLQAMQCLISSATGVLTYVCAGKLTGKERTARIALLLYILITGITAWLVIPYSDSTGLLLPVLLLYMALKFYEKNDDKKRYLYLCAIGFMTYFSYRLKPLACIVVIAFVILALVNIKKTGFGLKACISFAIGLLISVLTVNLAINSMGYELDPEAEFGWQHFIMQGVNEKSDGGNSDSDLAFSQSIPTKAERDRTNLEVAEQRIKEMGPLGCARLALVKVYRPFSSGTFGWGGVGISFYHEAYHPRFGLITKAMRSIFWEKEAYEEYEGSKTLYAIYQIFKQIIWNAVLILCIFASIRKEQLTDGQKLLYLSVIGIFPYFILMESHPRFMLMLSPLVILMSVMGYDKHTTK
ncbi:MAG: hypothetical protein K6A38_10160 [Lachnospiraceae bacterium]|nr:hypothetical protein [Lachnospiraceae bacterium]